MIKRVIGVTFTVVVFVVVIAATINWGGYRSMLFGHATEPESMEVVERVDSIVPKSDTLSVMK
jgi:hypothetical protein